MSKNKLEKIDEEDFNMGIKSILAKNSENKTYIVDSYSSTPAISSTNNSISSTEEEVDSMNSDVPKKDSQKYEKIIDALQCHIEELQQINDKKKLEYKKNIDTRDEIIALERQKEQLYKETEFKNNKTVKHLNEDNKFRKFLISLQFILNLYLAYYVYLNPQC